jgi:hypothetical protein
MSKFNGALILISAILVLGYLIFRPPVAKVYGLYETYCDNCPKSIAAWYQPGAKGVHETTTRIAPWLDYYEAAKCEKMRISWVTRASATGFVVQSTASSGARSNPQIFRAGLEGLRSLLDRGGRYLG